MIMIGTPYEIDGFAFSDESMMEKAAKETEGIRYVKNGTDMRDPQTVLLVYRQMVEQHVFETPVGYAFLYELQEYLRTSPAIDNDQIPPIPVITEDREPVRPKVIKNQPQKTKTKVVRKIKEQNVDYKRYFQVTCTIGVILFFIVVGMFAVTATSGNINIVNYENALIEKYENWEEQLDEREEKLKERENALQQNTQQIP